MWRSGGPTVAVAIVDELAVEAGGDFTGDRIAVGHLAARGTLNLREEASDGVKEGGFAGDFALGGGAGTSEDGAVAGGLVDAGAAGHVNRYFAWWIRSSGQVTEADRAPRTFWISGLTGPEVTISVVSLYAAGGVAALVTAADSVLGYTAEGGLSLHFSVFDAPGASTSEKPGAPRAPVSLSALLR